MIIKVLMLLLFFTIMVGIGFYCKQSATDVNGFVLGGRSVGPWLTAFAYGTSYFSAVVFVGYAGQFGWKYGIAATWAGIGNALIGSLLAWRILGRRTRIMTQHLDSATMPEFFGKRFGSENLKIAASVITFIFMIPYTASLYNGLSRLFGMAFNIDYSVCVVAMAVLTGIYVIVGGYMATAINDFIQGIIMLVGITAVILAVLGSRGGLMAAMDGLARVSDETVSSTPGVFASFFGPDPFNLLGVVILTSLGTWGLPQMVQKFYAIKNERSIETGTIISTLFAMVIAGGCYFLGGFGRLFSDQIDIAANGFDSVVPTMLSGLPDILIGVVVTDRRRGHSGAFRLHVHAVLPGPHLQLYHYAGPDPGTRLQETGREETAPDHALADRGLHPDLCHYRADPVPLQRDLHRAADGHLLGRHGRCVPGAFPVRPVLEEDLRICLLGMLYLLRRFHAGGYARTSGPAGNAPVPH